MLRLARFMLAYSNSCTKFYNVPIYVGLVDSRPLPSHVNQKPCIAYEENHCNAYDQSPHAMLE